MLEGQGLFALQVVMAWTLAAAAARERAAARKLCTIFDVSFISLFFEYEARQSLSCDFDRS